MITIRQIQSPVIVTDANNGSSPVSLLAGDTYTCVAAEVNDWLELEVDTTLAGTSNNDQFTIKPNFSTYQYEVDIMEGDGSVFIKGTSNTDSALTFTFATAGVNIIRIKGHIGLKYNGGDKDKITDVRNWGNSFTNANYAFSTPNMRNQITATDSLTISTTDLRTAFAFTGWSGNNAPFCAPALASSTFNSSALNANLGHWDMRACTDLNTFATSVTTWSQENYSNTLLGWLRWDSVTHAPATGYVLPSNVIFTAGTTIGTTSTVAIGSEAALARDYLINTLSWTIADGGAV